MSLCILVHKIDIHFIDNNTIHSCNIVNMFYFQIYTLIRVRLFMTVIGIKFQSHSHRGLSSSGPDAANDNPGWSVAIPARSMVNPWLILGISQQSGTVLGVPGSAPDVLDCLKHPGWSRKKINPWLVRVVWECSMSSPWQSMVNPLLVLGIYQQSATVLCGSGLALDCLEHLGWSRKKINPGVLRG